MVREILFRGKRIDNGEWVEGDLRHGGYYENDIAVYIMRPFAGTFENFPVYPDSVGQYAGLTDKNGKKIFEGDIVRTITFGFDTEMFVTEIRFGARHGALGFHLANGRMMFYFGQSDLTKMDDSEVIGNIHDNPELLEEK